MNILGPSENFLGIEETQFHEYADSRVVIQSLPYEHTSSYIGGSVKGPKAILDASHFVEFYDEELNQETYKAIGICALSPLEFDGKIDAEAIDLIESATDKLLTDDKFVVSLGAEHTVSFGTVKSFVKKYPKLSVLQLDAHSDLRESYEGNPYSHASVMARIYTLGVSIAQVGIRAQCKEEADLIAASDKIYTVYAHELRSDKQWMDELVEHLTDDVYITIDADGFDPSIMPAVGTPEPNGLFWQESLDLLKRVAQKKNIVGFDVLECAPAEGSILSEYTLAKLVYRLLGYKFPRKD